MRIGIYSDPHISFTSSILPTVVENDRYSARLRMCIDSFKWMYDVFDEKEVNHIICCGDMTDRYSLRAEEITALSECLSASHGIPETHIVGNHDMLNDKFYATSILNNFKHIEVYSHPTLITLEDKIKSGLPVTVHVRENSEIAKELLNFYESYPIKIGLLPYTKSKNVTHELLKSLSEADILFSHLDIKGSHLRSDYIMDDGVDPDMLKMYSDTVFNGHLHTREYVTSGVLNVGSLTSGSFSDNDNYIPGITIYDTVTREIEFIENPHAILFRKINAVSGIASLIKQLDDEFSRHDPSCKYAIRALVPYEFKDKAQKVIESRKDRIIASRIITDMSRSNSVIEESKTVIYDDRNLEDEMLKYLNDNPSVLRHPIDLYKQILDDCKEDSK